MMFRDTVAPGATCRVTVVSLGVPAELIQLTWTRTGPAGTSKFRTGLLDMARPLMLSEAVAGRLPTFTNPVDDTAGGLAAGPGAGAGSRDGGGVTGCGVACGAAGRFGAGATPVGCCATWAPAAGRRPGRTASVRPSGTRIVLSHRW